MIFKFSLTVSDNDNNLQMFGIFQLKSLGRAKNCLWTSAVNDFYPQCFVEPSG
jgi:general stress protein 26